jgi:hypothetical protein
VLILLIGVAMSDFVKKCFFLGVFGFCISILSLFKLNFMLGSHKLFFSGVNFILPLIGAFFSLPVTAFLISSLFVFKLLMGFSIVTMGLPTFIAACSWAVSSKILDFLLHVILPLSCMILFIMHPVAGQAFAYSFYWLIPIALYALGNKSTFFRALSATFLAHAVGSIIWLYTVPMTSAQWLSLIPVVAVERLVMTCGMVVLYYGLSWFLNLEFIQTFCIVRIRR